MNPILKPMFDDAMSRYAKFHKQETRDAVRILGPVLEAVCLDAKVSAARASEWLQAQAPETITRESVDEFVRDLTTEPGITMEAARAKTDSLARELAAQRPLTARETVLQERMQPLIERSADSLEEEIFEAYWGCLRVKDSDGSYHRGAELPRAVSRAMRSEEELQAELDRRDCATHGVTYRPPVNERDDLAYIPAMRG